MLKLLLICIICAAAMCGCEQQKQASAEVGAKPKEMIDKVTNDMNAAQELANEKAKDAEELESGADVKK